MLQLNRKECKATDRALTYWIDHGLIDIETANKLRNSYCKANFNWLKLSRYAFWIALCCIMLAITSFFTSNVFSHIILALQTAAPSIIITINILLAMFFYVYAFGLRKKNPELDLRNESIVFIGGLFTGVAIYFTGKLLLTGGQDFFRLILFATLVYGILALCFPSKLLWIITLLMSGVWFATKTTIAANYNLGMNYQLRLVLFGGVLVAASIIMQHWRLITHLQKFRQTTNVIGLLYLFISLWILSIFGNSNSMHDWYLARQFELLYWSILLALIALSAIYYGIKVEDDTTKRFGLVFTIINLYTQYFELFWKESNKALFFTLLGLSFWLLGSKAEKIVNSLQLKIKTKQK